MNRTKAWARGLVPVVLPLLLALVQNQALAQYQLNGDGISALGGVSSSANHSLQSVGGQAQPIGAFTNANHVLQQKLIPKIGSDAAIDQSILLKPGWNSILGKSAMNIATALAGIADKVVIVKNDAGQVYWPQFGVNQIGEIAPGCRYQINVHAAATLVYSSNPARVSRAAAAKAPAREEVAVESETSRHYSLSRPPSGVNAIVCVEAQCLVDDDEIAIYAAEQKLVGSGVVHEGKAMVTIWGDDESTQEIREGAGKDEALVLEAWSSTQQHTKALKIETLTDALTGESLDNALKYQTDAVWIASVEEAEPIPTEYSLSQNYPNPFNPSTVIEYGLPQETQVRLEVYDLLGRRVAVVVEALERAGFHQVVFENAGLSTGVYFYRLQAGRFDVKRKMMIVR